MDPVNRARSGAHSPQADFYYFLDKRRGAGSAKNIRTVPARNDLAKSIQNRDKLYEEFFKPGLTRSIQGADSSLASLKSSVAHVTSFLSVNAKTAKETKILQELKRQVDSWLGQFGKFEESWKISQIGLQQEAIISLDKAVEISDSKWATSDSDKWAPKLISAKTTLKELQQQIADVLFLPKKQD